MTELEKQMFRALEHAETALKSHAIAGANDHGELVYSCMICTAEHECKERINHDRTCPINRVRQALKAAQRQERNGDHEELAAEAAEFYSRVLPYKMQEKLLEDVLDAWDDFEAAIIAWREADNAK